MSITHATVATGTDAGTGDIHKAQWNEDHVFSGIARIASLAATESTYIGKSAGTPLANPGSSVDVQISSWWNGASDGYAKAALLTFDSSSLAGQTIFQAILYLTVTNWNNILDSNTSERLIVVESLRAYSASQATWSVYTTGNNWTTAGALGAGTDRSSIFAPGFDLAQSDVTNTEHGQVPLDITNLVLASIAAARTTLRLIVGFNIVVTNENPITVAGASNATTAERPTLRVLYS